MDSTTQTLVCSYVNVEPTCQDCAFFQRSEKTDNFGTCHRHAPVPGSTDHDVTWPSIHIFDWCGELKLKKGLSYG
jgi:hypothetical protein